MKLYDFDFGNCPCTTIESFEGHMIHLKTYGVTKSFNKAKKERIKTIKQSIDELEALLSELEQMEEVDVSHRDVF